jgi:hypothetical protein
LKSSGYNQLIALLALCATRGIPEEGIPRIGIYSRFKYLEDEETQDLKPGDFFPLELGLSWEYKGEENGGTVIASVFKTTPEAVILIYLIGEGLR